MLSETFSEVCPCFSCKLINIPCARPSLVTLPVLYVHCISVRRAAEPEFEMEEEVLDGDLAGSMYGVVEAQAPAWRRAASISVSS